MTLLLKGFLQRTVFCSRFLWALTLFILRCTQSVITSIHESSITHLVQEVFSWLSKCWWGMTHVAFDNQCKDAAVYSPMQSDRHVLIDGINVWMNIKDMLKIKNYLLWSVVALCNRADHYIFAPLFLSSIFFFFSLPNLSGRRFDVYHTLTHGVALVRI